MRTLGEQWIENDYGGKPHMYKAVGVNDRFDPCIGCCNQGREEECYNAHSNCGRGVVIIKDLGPVNEDGLLGCPFCGEFPTIKEELDENDERIYAVEHECDIDVTTGWNHDIQTVIEAWNRRA